MNKAAFKDILHKLYLQKGQEKLHISFKLSQFVTRLRMEGVSYAKKKSVTRAGRIA